MERITMKDITGKLLLTAIVLLLAPAISFAASCPDPVNNAGYVRQAATGTGSGADWTNAFTDLPSSLVRGCTYWVGVGTYAPHVFNDAVSGTTLITVKAPTASAHGTNTGWSNTYVGQAVWQCTSSPCTIWNFQTGNYYVMDGSYSTPLPGYTQLSTSGYGFKLYANGMGGNGNSGNDCVACGEILGSNRNQAGFPKYVHDLTFKYIEIYGNYQTAAAGLADAGYSDDGGDYNLYFGHMYIHGTTWQFFLRGNTQNSTGFGTGNDITIEYCYLYWDYTAPQSIGPHGTSCSCSQGLTNFTWRYNIIRDITGTSAGPDTASGGDYNTGNGNNGPWYIYGNIWWASDTSNCFVGDGMIAIYDTSFTSGWGGGNGGNIYYYDNTMAQYGYGFCNSTDNAGFGLGITYTTPLRGFYEQNNLWYMADETQIGPSDIPNNGQTSDSGATFNPPVVHGYDAYYYSPNDSNADTDANKQANSNSNPFTNISTGNFMLVADTSPGASLTNIGTYWNGTAEVANTFNVDMNGVTRGTNGVWDRGALQISSSGAPSPPTNVTATPH